MMVFEKSINEVSSFSEPSDNNEAHIFVIGCTGGALIAGARQSDPYPGARIDPVNAAGTKNYEQPEKEV
jgi:hypothetical protein